MAHRNLRSAARKLGHHGGREFYGYLTPAEIVALCAHGARPTHSSERIKQVAEERVKNGISGGMSFYCTISGEAEKAYLELRG